MYYILLIPILYLLFKQDTPKNIQKYKEYVTVYDDNDIHISNVGIVFL